MKYIIGVNCSGFLSSACLMKDGEVKYAICEERITRIKQDKSFPLKAIKYCCDAQGIKLSDISDIFIGWHPRYYLNKSDHMLNDALRDRGKLSYLSLNELSTFSEGTVKELKQLLVFDQVSWNIHYVDHHKAHLAHAYCASSFKSADFLILDGFGEIATGMCGKVTTNNIKPIYENKFPHSLGSFYATFTQFLGFRPNEDEWKVMALAALGDPGKYYHKVNNLIKVDDLSIELDLRFFEHFLFFTKQYYTKKFVEYFGPALQHGEEPTQEYWDIVAAVQKVVEDVVFQLLKNLQKQTNGKNLVLAGGFFMNSVLNGKIRKNAPYGNVYIGGSPDDSGISIGSALYGAYFDLKQKSKTQQGSHNYFGRKYSNQEVEQELKKRKIRYKKLSHTTKKGATIIRDGKILAWFQGSSEFGQRALGNRSILADPTRDDVKDIVNASVKYREGFRPFAPSVLKERQAEFFEDDGQFSYFMEKVFTFKKKWIKVLPGVVHFDGTGRLQTVDNSVNPKYYRLIAEFSKLSNVPIVLNTSFNVNGMPLVETPADAIDCFYASGIDALIMNDFLIEK